MRPDLFWGVCSGILALISAIIYLVTTIRCKNKPPLTSWILWAFIGVAIFITYWFSRGQHNLWSSVSPAFGAVSPSLVVVVLIIRRSPLGTLKWYDYMCCAFGFIALGLWLYAREDPRLADYALWIAIIADAFAAVPSFTHYLKDPSEDRPGAWVLFGVAYAISMLAFKDHDWGNYVLGIYMSLGGLAISLPLIRYRIQSKSPFWEWF